MTTEAGRKYVIDKLVSAKNLRELAAVWATIGYSYQRDAHIFQLKESLKRQMEETK